MLEFWGSEIIYVTRTSDTNIIKYSHVDLATDKLFQQQITDSLHVHDSNDPTYSVSVTDAMLVMCRSEGDLTPSASLQQSERVPSATVASLSSDIALCVRRVNLAAEVGWAML